MKKSEKNQDFDISRQSVKKISKSNDDLKQLHVNISSTLHRRFRVKVLEEGRSMNQVIEDLITSYLRE